jgi:hypothetical protein
MVGAEIKAQMYVLEHRYYGESEVSPNLNWGNLEHLTVQQAVEDVAFFIEEKNKEMIRDFGGKDRKWIVVGGTYAGGLAAWFKQEHPDLAHISWASSGTLNAIAEFKNFDKHVHTVSSKHSKECAKEILNI